MDKQAFKERMKSLKSYRELNPDKGYWDWKVLAFDGGGTVLHLLSLGGYKGKTYAEIQEEMRTNDPESYDRLQADVAREERPTSEIVFYKDADGNYQKAMNLPANQQDAVAEFLPGTGDVAELAELGNLVKEGNYGTAAAMAGLMWLPGNWNAMWKNARRNRKLAKVFADDPLITEMPTTSVEPNALTYVEEPEYDDFSTFEGLVESLYTDPEKAAKATTLARRDFLKKFNKWNKHYGYAPLDLNLSKNVNAMEEAIKERLVQHNTFVRGARDSNIDGRKAKTNQKLIEMGIAPTLDNRLKFYATAYAPETGSGRAGFTPRYPNEGVVYTANSLNTAKGYATPKEYEGKDTVGKMMKVRRHIDFEGNDYVDWVNKADFAFANNPASVLWYQYELPYLMRTGKSLGSELMLPSYLQYLKEFRLSKKVLADEFYKFFYPKHIEARLERILRSWPVDVLTINSILPETEQISLKINEYDSPVTKVRKIFQMQDIKRAAQDYFYYKADPLSDNLSSLMRKIKVPIYRKDHYYTLAKQDMQNRLNHYVRTNLGIRPPRYLDFAEDMKAALDREGILPNPVTDGIITSEPMRKTTRNKGNAYLHFLFRGDIGEKALDFVEFVDDAEAPDFYTRSHEGDWWPGYSRKSYADGGVVPAYGDGTDGDDLMSLFITVAPHKKTDTSIWGDLKNWWNTLNDYKNYAYGNDATLPNGNVTTLCAQWSNAALRNAGYSNIVGDAWTRASHSGMKKITSGYDGLVKPDNWDEADAHTYLKNASENFVNKVDTTNLQNYDVIGLYYPDSPNTKKAFENGVGKETQTHTGHVAVGKDGTHYVVHNVDGHLKMHKVADLMNNDGDYRMVSAHRPVKKSKKRK